MSYTVSGAASQELDLIPSFGKAQKDIFYAVDFSTIPEDLLLTIISLLENHNIYQTTNHMSLVCRNWFHIVNNYYLEVEKRVIALSDQFLFEDQVFPKRIHIRPSIKVRGNQIISLFTKEQESISQMYSYDIEKKQGGKTLIISSPFVSKCFQWLSNNKIAILNNDFKIMIYNFTPENELEFDKEFSIRPSIIFKNAKDNQKKVMALVDNMKTIFYKVNGDVVSFSHDSERERFSVCKKVCFAGEKLFALLEVNDNHYVKNKILLDNAQNYLRSFDSVSKEFSIKTFEARITHIAGDDNTLVVGGKGYINILNPQDLTSKLSSDNDISKFEIHVCSDLWLKDGKIIIHTYGKFGIFSAQTGRLIMEGENWGCIKIDGQFAAIAIDQTSMQENCINLYNLKSRKIIVHIPTVLAPLALKFKVKNEKNPCLIAAFPGGKIRVWKNILKPAHAMDI
jgi:hypothetical protein